MLGIDTHSWGVLLPSMIGIIGITVAMVYFGVKLRSLMYEDQDKK